MGLGLTTPLVVGLIRSEENSAYQFAKTSAFRHTQMISLTSLGS